MLWLLAVGLSVVVLPGCAVSRLPPGPELPGPLRAAIRERVRDTFTCAVLIKPAETRQTNSPAFRLAPLILQEVPESEAGGPRLSPATVHFSQDKIAVGRQSHDRFTYWWRYDAAADASLAGLPMQGVRITLDSEGEPAIWEVLADTLGARILYVSESLEDAAKARFRKPRPGRRFVSERDLREAPGAVVAQWIPEGPEPMGPILYLRAGTHDVGALTCRCMPSQAERLAGQGLYQLVAGDEAAAMFESMHPNRLEDVLRLPRRF